MISLLGVRVMKRFLRNIRRIEVINKLLRVALKFTHFQLERLFLELQKRWPTSGFIDCEFKGLKFKMYNQCDDGLIHYFYYNVKYYDETDLSLFVELSTTSNCALDIGANTGLFSILSSIAN